MILENVFGACVRGHLDRPVSNSVTARQPGEALDAKEAKQAKKAGNPGAAWYPPRRAKIGNQAKRATEDNGGKGDRAHRIRRVLHSTPGILRPE